MNQCVTSLSTVVLLEKAPHFRVGRDIERLPTLLVFRVQQKWRPHDQHVGDFEVTITRSLVQHCATTTHLLLLEQKSLIQEKQSHDFVQP